VKLHFRGNGRQRKQTWLFKPDHVVKVLDTCQIHTNITTVAQNIILSSVTIFQFKFTISYNLPILMWLFFKVCGFASETKTDDRYPELVLVSSVDHAVSLKLEAKPVSVFTNRSHSY